MVHGAQNHLVFAYFTFHFKESACAATASTGTEMMGSSSRPTHILEALV